MTIRFKKHERSLKIQSQKRVLSGLTLIPTIVVNNWLPQYPFYHVSLLWLRFSVDAWWLNYA